MSITKIYTRKVNRGFDYATLDDLVDELHIFEKQIEWSISEVLKILIQRKVDCFSITKEKPFKYLYARLNGEQIFFRLQTDEMETEFSLPIEKLMEN